MTRKVFAFAMALLAMSMLFTACSQSAAQPEKENAQVSPYEGTLEELVSAIYEQKRPEFMVGEAMAIDLSNADALVYYLGLSDASGLKEAVFSEPMMSSQAYSLCAVRVEEGADMETIAQSILDNVDPVKWICVNADQVQVSAAKDIILLTMVDSNLSADLGSELHAAFLQVCGVENASLNLNK